MSDGRTAKKKTLYLGILVLAMFMLAFPFAAPADTWYVSQTTGTDTPGCGSQGSPCASITYTIDSLYPIPFGTTIQVAAGIYNETAQHRRTDNF